MPTPLEKTLQQLASNFAEHVLEALRGLSLDEILSATAGAGGKKRPSDGEPRKRGRGRAAAGVRAKAVAGERRSRRSDEDITEVVERIVAILKKNKAGLRAERLRAELALPRKELQRPIAHALAEGKIRKEGEKRSTTYFLR